MAAFKSEIDDMRTVIATIGMTKRCPGGRLIVSGYVCVHCGNEFDEPKTCGAPTPENREKVAKPLVVA